MWNEFQYYKWQLTLAELAHDVFPLADTSTYRSLRDAPLPSNFSQTRARWPPRACFRQSRGPYAVGGHQREARGPRSPEVHRFGAARSPLSMGGSQFRQVEEVGTAVGQQIHSKGQGELARYER